MMIFSLQTLEMQSNIQGLTVMRAVLLKHKINFFCISKYQIKPITEKGKITHISSKNM